MTLTAVQRKLLKLLALNCRYSNKDIAQVLGVSPDTVQYQIDKLVREQYISFEFHIDCRSFGYEYYQFFIAATDPLVNVDAIAAMPIVTFFGKTTGAYDYNGTFIAKTDKEREGALKEIRRVFGKTLRTLHVARLGHEYKWTYIIEPFAMDVPLAKNKKNFLYDCAHENMAVVPHTVSVDALDLRILGELAQDPRASYVHMAQRLQVSHETVRNRLRQMRAQGLAMNFTTFCNFDKFGYFLYCLPLRVGEFDRKAFANFIEQKKYLQYATEFDGDFTMMIYVSAQDPQQFARHATEIRQFFGAALHDMQLLYFEKQLKNLQFPTALIHSP